MTNALISILPNTQQDLLIQIAQTYHQAGYLAVLVGGSVRDLLLEQVPKDFDFATNAPVEVSFKLFKKVIPTGVKHGTVTLIFSGHSIEVTCFRKDVQTDGRHAVVQFSDSLEDDLCRRDLRINAIAYNLLTQQLVDPQAGLADIQNRQVHFVGAAKQRILEDHLRGIRYIRMIQKLRPFGFSYQATDLEEVRQVFQPEFLSIERIYDELKKMQDTSFEGLGWLVTQLSQLRIFRQFLSDQAHTKALHWMFLLKSHTPLAVLSLLEKDTPNALEVLRLTKQEKRQTRILLNYLPQDLHHGTTLKSFLSRCSVAERLEMVKLIEGLSGQEVVVTAQKIIDQKEPLDLAQLAIGSDDLIKRGYTGAKLGEIQHFLLEQVWKDPNLNQIHRLRRLCPGPHSLE